MSSVFSSLTARTPKNKGPAALPPRSGHTQKNKGAPDQVGPVASLRAPMNACRDDNASLVQRNRPQKKKGRTDRLCRSSTADHRCASYPKKRKVMASDGFARLPPERFPALGTHPRACLASMWVRWRLWMVCRSSACPPQRCLHLGMLHGVALPKGSKVFLNSTSVLIKKCMPALAVLAFLDPACPPWRCLHLGMHSWGCLAQRVQGLPE